ncbi:hypothetical protein [Kutzneria kofuensis]|uniref:Alpha amylase inhibitor n=1 Tax=Kutzneria kofuensis TaxID=103725 RepID=A0A7W9KKE2_9PSEU|nr:hypothetical protein [Kutzneria kofuensis]MBB5894197.1 hypothetical protein [Kutzneria kofuensis]
MRTLLVAVLMLASAGVAVADTGLHDCGTRLDRTSALGWCRGTGAFSMDVTCADGTVEHSGTVYIRDGYGLVGASCFNRPQSARIVVKS